MALKFYCSPLFSKNIADFAFANEYAKHKDKAW